MNFVILRAFLLVMTFVSSWFTTIFSPFLLFFTCSRSLYFTQNVALRKSVFRSSSFGKRNAMLSRFRTNKPRKLGWVRGNTSAARCQGVVLFSFYYQNHPKTQVSGGSKLEESNFWHCHVSGSRTNARKLVAMLNSRFSINRKILDRC